MNPLNPKNRKAEPESDEDLGEFLPHDVVLDTEGLTAFDRFLRTFDHSRFRQMPPGKQILYLQLLRWTHGRQAELIEASRTQMSEWTGLSFDTIKKYVPGLIEEGLVTMLRPPTNITPAAYEVHWLPPEDQAKAAMAGHPDQIVRFIDQLDDHDRKELARLDCLVTGTERRQLYSEIRWEFGQLGVGLTPALVKHLAKWRILMRSPYRRTVMGKHPQWFEPPTP